MRKTKILLPLISMLLLSAGVAWASGGIKGTDHDFTPTGASAGGSPDFTAPVGLCTYCHTPHNAVTNRLIWNHELPGTTYSWSDVTKTIGGTDLPPIPSNWSGPSKFCLSCHDGTVDVGKVYWFSEGPQDFNAGVKMTASHTMTSGSSLNGNHPVAVPYPYLGVGNNYNGVNTGSTVQISDFETNPQTNGIRLFNDASGVVLAGASAGHAGIECSSCHDPHNGPTAVGDMFLRGTLTGSDKPYICLQCHSK